MKCIHYYNPENRIVRVDDEAAHAAVKAGAARYVSRHVWKDKIRDLGKNVAAMIAARDAEQIG